MATPDPGLNIQIDTSKLIAADPDGPVHMLTDYGISKIAKEAAQAALAEDRANRKLGREDIGSGSTTVGLWLKQAREGAGLSQRRLAERSGLHPTTIGKIETGERGMSLRVFAKIVWAMTEDEGDEFLWSVIEYFGS